MHTEASLSRRIARVLERGTSSFAPFGIRALVKRLDLPPRARVIGVGGATLGGSGKTPLAIAIVRALVERGERAVFVAHGYRGRIDGARRVLLDDLPGLVGDESLIAARRLSNVAPVVVGRDRREALAFAATLGDTLVVDHLHQTRPRALDRAVLALDAHGPWGSGRTFPFGDLLAAPSVLSSLADVVVHVGGDDARPIVSLPSCPARVGLITSVARPERVLETLRDAGVEPIVHVERADHARTRPGERRALESLAARHALDLWLADEKSSIRLGDRAGALIHVLAHRLELSPSIVDRLARSC